MPEIVVVGAFIAKPGKEEDARGTRRASEERPHPEALKRVDELFQVSDITAYNPLPGGESRKGSPAEHAGSAA